VNVSSSLLRPFKLRNQIQHYEWGTRDKAAYIPQLLGIEAEPDRPYAELWIGAHPKAPSEITLDGTSRPLDQVVSVYPQEILGEAVASRFGGAWPYLLKVLSAADALSLQAHPDKAQAERLHRLDPEHYPDDNHKPEVAIALDALTALIGFRSYDQIVSALERYPELAENVAPDLPRRMAAARSATARSATPRSVPEQRALFREFFSALIAAAEARPAELGKRNDRLAERLLASRSTLNEREQLFFHLQAKYGSQDLGLVMLYLLNLVHLEAGQGVYTRAGVPHAYIGGNIVECMANSDNVIRAGLTPKYRDASALLEVVEYELGPVRVLEGGSGLGRVTYPTPAAEFQVSRWGLERGAAQTVRTEGSPRVLLVIRGELSFGWGRGELRESLRQGESVLIPALLPGVELEATADTLLFDVQVPA